jgi:hypothetical protein
MSLKSFLFLKFSQWKVKKELETNRRANFYQTKFLHKILRSNQNTQFGREHQFNQINDYIQFQKNIPIRSYEDFLPYIEKVKSGEKNVLTKSDLEYLLMTSGTTAGSKYIPITKSGIKHQIDAALKVLCFFANQSGKADFIKCKMIFLQGSPALDYSLKIPAGRLSGVVYHHVPKFFQRNKLPSYEANKIDDWQTKLDAIVDETYRENISILGGIPPWCMQYFEKLLSKSNKSNLKSLYPNLAMYIHGGLDFSNYRDKMQNQLGDEIPCLQTFPASEGFFALQDRQGAEDMLLLLNQGVFYEFRNFQNEKDELATIGEVKLNTRYELIITNDSGLYRYAIGDLIEFTSLTPYRIKVVGRTSQFISAFGEHVIAYEVEKAMERASASLELKIDDYYVSADVEKKQYIWQVESANLDDKNKLNELSAHLDIELSSINKYYHHLLQGKIINSCAIHRVETGFFSKVREKSGKIGGQNKVVRLGNYMA